MDETVEAIAKGAPRLTVTPQPFKSSSHVTLELTTLGPEPTPKPKLENHSTHSHSHSGDDGHTHSYEHSHDRDRDHSHHEDRHSHDPREHDSDPESLKIRQFYDVPPSMDIEEASYLLRTILSFKYYQRHTFATNHVRMQNFYSLPESQRQLLQPQFTQKLEAIDHAIVKNGILSKRIAKLGEEMYLGGKEVRTGGPLTPRQKDMDKARSTLKQFVRDWGIEGMKERELSYAPILNALNAIYGNLTAEEKAGIHVLVPGAGLGRILYEILRAGYTVQGNELEFCMLMASNLALNELSPEAPYELYPYIHVMSHHRSPEDLVRCISIPDESPLQGLRTSGTKGQMSMVAGDFIECYSSPPDAGNFSVVVTCFFLDTAANVLKYIETIHHVLAKNGVWINLGPLAWHFEPDADHTRPGGNIELTLSELIAVILKNGFKFESGPQLDQRTISTPYMADPKGMLTYMYDAEFWVARKL